MLDPHLINDPFGDPGIFLELRHRKEAFLLDMGDLTPLPPRKILKVTHAFVTHTHMDHFIGFDHFLRVSLGRDQKVHLFGPPGFMNNVEGKFGAYTWNLVENYTNRLHFLVTEAGGSRRKTARYDCSRGFRRESVGESDGKGDLLVDRDDLTVRGVLLDHKVPCLALAIEEKRHIHIKKNALDEMNLPVGPWLGELKRSILRNDPEGMEIEVRGRRADSESSGLRFPLGLLRDRIVRIAAGEKVAYVADAVYSEENRRKIVELAAGARVLIVEAPFLHEDRERAFRKFHLTAAQAGSLAREAGAKNLVVFHFSPMYRSREDELVREAREAFRGSLPDAEDSLSEMPPDL